MLIKTSKYQLQPAKYRKIAMMALLKKEWWYAALPLLICGGYFWIDSLWWIIGGVTLAIGYLLFWLVQFAGLPQLEQGKVLFERLSYEITSQQILVKLNTKQGMPIKWDMIKRANVTKEGFILSISKAHIMFLPFKIFNNENQIKFVKSILTKKGLTK